MREKKTMEGSEVRKIREKQGQGKHDQNVFYEKKNKTKHLNKQTEKKHEKYIIILLSDYGG
jgi:hypothetical protein